jgi:hypothetical protein
MAGGAFCQKALSKVSGRERYAESSRGIIF